MVIEIELVQMGKDKDINKLTENKKWLNVIHLLSDTLKRSNKRVVQYEKDMFDCDRIHKLLEETKTRINFSIVDRSIRHACDKGSVHLLKWHVSGEWNHAKNNTELRILTPLMTASCGKSLNIVHLLLYYGVSINDVTIDGESALMFAVRYNKYNIASLLIKHGADINQTCTRDGCNIFMTALRCKNNNRMIKLLLNANITPNVVHITNNGLSTLDILEMYHPEMSEVRDKILDLYKRQERKGIKRAIQKAASELNVISCDDTEHVITLFSGAF